MTNINRREFLENAVVGAAALSTRLRSNREEKHLLYVASPGIRNYVEYGGIGVLVYDAADRYGWVKRIPTMEVKAGEEPENVKGICASAKTGRLYVSTLKRLICLDLLADRIIWNKTYEGGCDRMAISPDGSHMYLPSFEGPHWNVVDGLTGDVIAKIETKSGAHNTIYGLD